MTDFLPAPFETVLFIYSDKASEQAQEVQSGLWLLNQALGILRTSVTNTALHTCIDTSIQNLLSINAVLRSLNVQVRWHSWLEREGLKVDSHGFVCKGKNFNLKGIIDNIVYSKQLFVCFSGIRPASKSGGDRRNVDGILNKSTASGPDQLPAWKSTPRPCKRAGLPGRQLIHIRLYCRRDDHLRVRAEGPDWLAHRLPRSAWTDFFHRVAGSCWADAKTHPVNTKLNIEKPIGSTAPIADLLALTCTLRGNVLRLKVSVWMCSLVWVRLIFHGL